jgi:FKBP-type peptidyl-prolyl cis-trans isomerase SlyD
MVLQAMTPDGPVNFQVTKVAGDVVVADFNHPMAGRRLHFDVKVAEVRVATEADMAMFGCGGECDHGCGGCGGH